MENSTGVHDCREQHEKNQIGTQWFNPVNTDARYHEAEKIESASTDWRQYIDRG